VPRKLHNALVPASLVSVGIGDLPGAPHEVLQILPAHPGGEVLNDDSVLSPGRRAVFLQPDGTVAIPSSTITSSSTVSAPAPGPPAASSAAPPVLVPAVRSPLGQLAGHTVPEEVGSVKIIGGVLRVTIVLKLDESILALDKDVPDPAVFSEEPLDIFLACSWRNASEVHSS